MYPLVLSDFSFINNSSSLFAFQSWHAPAPSSSFVQTRPALGVRRGDLLLIGPTPWPTLLGLQWYIFTLAHALPYAYITLSHTLRQTETNIKNERFRWRERQEAGKSPLEWQTALSERALVVVTSIGTFEQTIAGLEESSIKWLTVDSSLFVPHSA